MFRMLPQITHQTPFNSDYFSIYYMLYINRCFSKKAHIIAIRYVAFIRHLTETNLECITLVIIFALILHCFLSSILKLASLVGWCLSLESGRTDFSDCSIKINSVICTCSFTYNDQYSPLNTASRSVNNRNKYKFYHKYSPIIIVNCYPYFVLICHKLKNQLIHK